MSTSAEAALDVSDFVLSILSNAAQHTPVPCLAIAAGLALGLVNLIQSVKDNKEAYSQLGKDASEIVSFIICHDPRARQDAASLPPVYLKQTEDLSRTLAEICKFVEEKLSRNRADRLIQGRSDIATIQEYRERLKHSLEVFIDAAHGHK
ncbi:hypothetical protein C0992_007306 [Termitomyces sp. T32_za158]|nr:hypothetical protein C0992_007306 [Termitomyces sp. T32_za158]